MVLIEEKVMLFPQEQFLELCTENSYVPYIKKMIQIYINDVNNFYYNVNEIDISNKIKKDIDIKFISSLDKLNNNRISFDDYYDIQDYICKLPYQITNQYFLFDEIKKYLAN